MYKDYLRFAKLLGLDLKNNRYAFPKNLKESHDELEKQYEINNKKIINLAIVKRSNELLKNTFNDGKFIVLPATSNTVYIYLLLADVPDDLNNDFSRITIDTLQGSGHFLILLVFPTNEQKLLVQHLLPQQNH